MRRPEHHLPTGSETPLLVPPYAAEQVLERRFLRDPARDTLCGRKTPEKALIRGLYGSLRGITALMWSSQYGGKKGLIN